MKSCSKADDYRDTGYLLVFLNLNKGRRRDSGEAGECLPIQAEGTPSPLKPTGQAIVKGVLSTADHTTA